MNEYKQFKEMTKPMKFRTIRRMWNTFRDVMKNSYYDLLYLLNILDKITIVDSTSRDCATIQSNIGLIITPKVRCEVSVKIIEYLEFTDIHYKTKSGKIIPILYEEKPTVEFVGRPVDIAFNFNDTGYIKFENYNVKIVLPLQEQFAPFSFDESSPLEPVKVKLMEIDTSVVRSLRCKQHISSYYTDLQDFMIESLYRTMVRRIENEINSIDWDLYTRKEQC